jgi:hypothetical protein
MPVLGCNTHRGSACMALSAVCFSSPSLLIVSASFANGQWSKGRERVEGRGQGLSAAFHARTAVVHRIAKVQRYLFRSFSKKIKIFIQIFF